MSEVASMTLQSFSDEIEKIADSVGLSVVSVGGDGRAGTGIAWDDNHIITAHHVVSGLETAVVSYQGSRTEGVVKGHNTPSDIAVLEIGTSVTPVPRGDSERLRVGQFALALANPYDSGVGATSGIVTGVKKRIGTWWNLSIRDAIVTDARVNPGYSGGPLVNASGQMIGMNVAHVYSRGVAVPVNSIGGIVESILSGTNRGKPYLGITLNIVEVPGGETRSGAGLIILSVENGSPAEGAGLVLGDVILQVDGRDAAEELRYGSMLGDGNSSEEVELLILRGGKKLKIVARPAFSKEV